MKFSEYVEQYHMKHANERALGEVWSASMREGTNRLRAEIDRTYQISAKTLACIDTVSGYSDKPDPFVKPMTLALKIDMDWRSVTSDELRALAEVSFALEAWKAGRRDVMPPSGVWQEVKYQ